MRSLLKSRKGLSTVVTTLIILVVSVLLATVVTFYAINITTTRVETENLKITKAHIWANSSEAQAAFVLINVGGRDVLLDKITVRDQESDWGNVYYWFSTAAITAELEYSNSVNSTVTTSTWASIMVGTTPQNFTQASDDIAVPSGSTLVVYIRSPDSITVSDIGVSTRITIHSANAMYSKEVNCQYIES